MRIILCLMLMTVICSAEVKIYRYTDSITGDERGVCNSSRDGTPAITNPDWDMEEISENDRDYYIKLHESQKAAARDVIKQKKRDIKSKIKTKVGLTDEELDILLGETN